MEKFVKLKDIEINRHQVYSNGELVKDDYEIHFHYYNAIGGGVSSYSQHLTLTIQEADMLYKKLHEVLQVQKKEVKNGCTEKSKEANDSTA